MITLLYLHSGVQPPKERSTRQSRKVMWLQLWSSPSRIGAVPLKRQCSNTVRVASGALWVRLPTSPSFSPLMRSWLPKRTPPLIHEAACPAPAR